MTGLCEQVNRTEINVDIASVTAPYQRQTYLQNMRTAALLILFACVTLGTAVKTTTETVGGINCYASVSGGIAVGMFKNTATFERNYLRLGNRDGGEIYMPSEYFSMDCSVIGTAAMDSIDAKMVTGCNKTVIATATRTCWSSASAVQISALMIFVLIVMLFNYL